MFVNERSCSFLTFTLRYSDSLSLMVGIGIGICMRLVSAVYVESSTSVASALVRPRSAKYPITCFGVAFT